MTPRFVVKYTDTREFNAKFIDCVDFMIWQPYMDQSFQFHIMTRNMTDNVWRLYIPDVSLVSVNDVPIPNHEMVLASILSKQIIGFRLDQPYPKTDFQMIRL